MKKKDGKLRYVLFGCVAFALLLLAMTFTGGISMSGIGKKEYIVGKDIKAEDITDFYFTYDSSAYPPLFQRYRLYPEDGKYFFYHETREGDHWPLTESDITVSAAKELSPEQWDEFFGLLEGGKVRSREENLESGDSGPWLFLYWKNDKGDLQEYTFESYGKQKTFEELCITMKESQ